MKKLLYLLIYIYNDISNDVNISINNKHKTTNTIMNWTNYLDIFTQKIYNKINIYDIIDDKIGSHRIQYFNVENGTIIHVNNTTMINHDNNKIIANVIHEDKSGANSGKANKHANAILCLLNECDRNFYKTSWENKIKIFNLIQKNIFLMHTINKNEKQFIQNSIKILKMDNNNEFIQSNFKKIIEFFTQNAINNYVKIMIIISFSNYFYFSQFTDIEYKIFDNLFELLIRVVDDIEKKQVKNTSTSHDDNTTQIYENEANFVVDCDDEKYYKNIITIFIWYIINNNLMYNSFDKLYEIKEFKTKMNNLLLEQIITYFYWVINIHYKLNINFEISFDEIFWLDKIKISNTVKCFHSNYFNKIMNSEL